MSLYRHEKCYPDFLKIQLGTKEVVIMDTNIILEIIKYLKGYHYNGRFIYMPTKEVTFRLPKEIYFISHTQQLIPEFNNFRFNLNHTNMTINLPNNNDPAFITIYHAPRLSATGYPSKSEDKFIQKWYANIHEVCVYLNDKYHSDEFIYDNSFNSEEPRSELIVSYNYNWREYVIHSIDIYQISYDINGTPIVNIYKNIDF